MSQKSLLGWGVLAVALAVPAVLVWNVRMKIKGVQPMEYKMKTPPAGGEGPASDAQPGTQAPTGAQFAFTAAAAGSAPAGTLPAGQDLAPQPPSGRGAFAPGRGSVRPGLYPSEARLPSSLAAAPAIQRIRTRSI